MREGRLARESRFEGDVDRPDRLGPGAGKGLDSDDVETVEAVGHGLEGKRLFFQGP